MSEPVPTAPTPATTESGGAQPQDPKKMNTFEQNQLNKEKYAISVDQVDANSEDACVVKVNLKKSPRTLGIALSKSKSGRVFVNRFRPCTDGSKGAAETENLIRPKDIITHVNGQEAKDMETLVNLIKESGEDLELTILRTKDEQKKKEMDDALMENSIKVRLGLMQIFADIDKDNSGTIELKELSNVSSVSFRKLGITLPAAEDKSAFFKSLFEGADADNSGSVDFYEFHKFLLGDKAAKLCAETRLGEYKAIFSAMDTDKSNSLDASEVTAAVNDASSLFNTYFPMFSKRMKAAMDEFDHDKDGQITWKEFVKGAEDIFARNAPREHALSALDNQTLQSLEDALAGITDDDKAKWAKEAEVISAESKNDSALENKLVSIIDKDPTEATKNELDAEVSALTDKIADTEKSKPQSGLFGTSTEAQKKHKNVMAELLAKKDSMLKKRENVDQVVASQTEAKKRLEAFLQKKLEKEKERGLKQLEKEKAEREKRKKVREAAEATRNKEDTSKGTSPSQQSADATPKASNACCVIA